LELSTLFIYSIVSPDDGIIWNIYWVNCVFCDT
jgi:hypothetical protein